MCGIFGSTGSASDTALAARVAGMGDALRHRGPDDMGIVAYPGGLVGMSRLRICSRPEDAVPFRCNAGIAAFNGEIYGRLDTTLRLGPAPSGGAGEVDMLFAPDAAPPEGMFAAAVAAPGGHLTLKRDAFGIKPLYLLRHGQGIAFASELLPLLRHFGAGRIDRDAAADCLLFGRPIGPATIATDIHRLPPGATLRVLDGEIRIDAQPPAQPRANLARGQRLEREDLEIALRESVEACMVAKRPVGLALSGGIDSTLIAALACQLGVEGLATVSVTAAGADDGIADLGGLGLSGRAWETWSHGRIAVGPDDLPGLLRAAVGAWGMPTRMTSLPLYLALARQASDSGIVVLLTGEGADELFLGYRRYPELLRRLAESDDKLALLMHGLIGGSAWVAWAQRLLGAKRVDACEARFRAAHAEVERLAPAEALRTLEFAYSLDPLLARCDAALMAKSIEGRTPYLHAAVPAIATALPVERLVSDDSGKRPLYELARRLLVPGKALPPKKRFRAPVTEWISGPLAHWTAQTLSDSVEPLAEAGFQPEGVRALAEQTANGNREVAGIAYAMLTQALAAREVLGQSAFQAACDG